MRQVETPVDLQLGISSLPRSHSSTSHGAKTVHFTYSVIQSARRVTKDYHQQVSPVSSVSLRAAAPGQTTVTARASRLPRWMRAISGRGRRLSPTEAGAGRL